MSKKIGKVKPVKITEEMQKSYLDYAMSVIVSRALPDVRDGLKPVHRRILFAMHEMGLTHSAKHTKSAKVIGNAMGRYHPHGDQAIYDALVRLVQDFSMRYPLIDGQGNFGSIDGDPPAAMRYCVGGDTLVLTNKGTIPIEKISPKQEEKINLRVLNYQGRIVRTSKFFDSGKQAVIKITTKRGYELKGSWNHLILCWELNDFGFPTLQWNLLENITSNDHAIINRNFPLFSKRNPSLTSFHSQNLKYKNIKLPTAMNEEIAFLLGALVAEGSFHQKQILFNNQDLEFYKKIKNIIETQFPGVQLYERNIKRNCRGLSLYHQKAVKFLKNIGLNNVKSDKKEIPFTILFSKKETIRQFLVALFEGDGSVIAHKDKRHQGRSIELVYNSKSYKLIKQLKVLLLNFGILTSAPLQDKRNGCYKLLISGRENIQKFKDEIGFFSQRKRTTLVKISKINSERMSKTDWIPFLNNYLRTNYHHEFIQKNNIDRYNKLEKNYPQLKKFLKSQDLKLIKWLLENKFFFDRIKTIEKLPKKEKVYSLKVDDRSHSFIANGFINHNTEARMSKIATEMLTDIDKNTVDYVDNFDASLKEPVFLPAKIPNLLLMGADGIAVGMATKIPPHNLKEVVDSLILLIDKGRVVLPELKGKPTKGGKEFDIKKIQLDEKIDLEKPSQIPALKASFESEATVEDLIKYIKGPDFPTGAFIYDKDQILQAYSTGKGKILMRADTQIEERKGKRFRIAISQIPYQVNKAQLVAKIAQLIKERKIKGVGNLRDESDRQGMRIVLELKKTAKPNVILNFLHKHTAMQTTYPVNMVALIDGVPQTLTLKQILTEFVKHRQQVITRRSVFELEAAKRRAHILEGLKIALDNLNAVIATIKKSRTVETARTNLMKKFKLTEIQANAILEMQLRRLAALERKKIEDEYKEIGKLIEYLAGVLTHPEEILQIIKKELREVQKKYGDPRRTKIYRQQVESFADEDLIPKEKCLITVTKTGYIKRLPISTYRSQRRGGKGVKGMTTKEADEIAQFMTGETHDQVLFFTNKGRVFSARAWEIPEGARTSKGQAVINLINIDQGEKVHSVLNLPSGSAKNKYKYLLMATRKGTVKKTSLRNFKKIRSSGLIAIKLNRGDELCWVEPTTGKDQVLLATHNGKSIRFNETDTRPMGRDTIGVRGILLKGNDYVVTMEVFPTRAKRPKDRRRKYFRHVLVVMEKGLGKRTDIRYHPIQKRGGIGVKAANVTKKTGKIVVCRLVTQKDKQVILSSKKGQVIKLPLKNIPRLGRDTQGVILMRFSKKDDAVAALTCLQR